LIRRFHEAKLANAPSVTVWGSGTPKREFLYSEDMADACVYLMNLPDEKFVPLLGQDRNDGLPPLMKHRRRPRSHYPRTGRNRGGRSRLPGHTRIRRSKPDGTPRKLMDVGRLNAMGWKATTDMRSGLATAYQDFTPSCNAGRVSSVTLSLVGGLKAWKPWDAF